ncbi:MAG: hypothetical protein IPN61_09505 [Bacteroidetes bacterium]|nr:hypothetical protein [Bacteroidota bacterium]MBK9413640.1 hypothetical protein [Bacteroidota bacterium]MBP6658109.1 hypothetical protein [Bacteroidia bacterium]
MNMIRKESRIKETMDSIYSIEKLPVSEELIQRIKSVRGKVIDFTIKPSVRLAIAASVAVLFFINYYALNKTSKGRSSEKSIFATEYFSYMNSL